MKRITIWALAAGLLAGTALTSCDTSSDTTDTTTNDCAVTAVTLGTLKRTVETKSASTGNDTTFTVNVSGSLYPMSIDQLNNRIYNADSLPTGTNADRTVFSTFTASGTVAIRSLSDGKDTLFVQTDSTDCRTPRTLRVYSADGTMQREYTLEVRVHKEEADSFVWSRLQADAASPTASYTASRLLCSGTTLCLFGTKADGTSSLSRASVADGAFGDEATITSANGEAIDVRSIQLMGGTFWAMAGERLVASATGTGVWNDVNTGVAIASLIGATADSLYAVTADSRIVASADGVNWSAQTAGTDGTLPASHMASAAGTSHTDAGITTIVWLGRDAQGNTSVWKHDIDSHADHTFPWVNIPQTEELRGYGCPALSQPALVAYDGGVVLLGITDGAQASPLYASADLGRTWKSTTYRSPSIAAPASIAATVDGTQHIWVVCGGTGEVGRGRINRLGWTDDPKTILKTHRR